MRLKLKMICKDMGKETLERLPRLPLLLHSLLCVWIVLNSESGRLELVCRPVVHFMDTEDLAFFLNARHIVTFCFAARCHLLSRELHSIW